MELSRHLLFAFFFLLVLSAEAYASNAQAVAGMAANAAFVLLLTALASRLLEATTGGRWPAQVIVERSLKERDRWTGRWESLHAKAPAWLRRWISPLGTAAGRSVSLARGVGVARAIVSFAFVVIGLLLGSARLDWATWAGNIAATVFVLLAVWHARPRGALA